MNARGELAKSLSSIEPIDEGLPMSLVLRKRLQTLG